jgi:hypothetical protein
VTFEERCELATRTRIQTERFFHAGGGKADDDGMVPSFERYPDRDKALRDAGLA